ncbi:MAG: LUD domain-containing protein [Hoeflea sp.]|uniref:LutC/YkgG family protein n=1 Tax=Hoeflea sp. TaxID=1940281 RepID=UPI001DAE04A8|nr:LUD domain-containing protein [Hoeflea sp.]MBU4529153.1 LUD domain-containing protein [Alphaproteobacteria bacterium]MBU4543558.1 LUD domain-containing protein [Alphaproteobacteria bacterium]MBU4549183.1 LUD domain-containing protein [Alphaproteobacteria bacterium]MBV1725318.1 LUD domain-containing protein [Hoeflea sp.]MBV1785279.1 LUD domain-containing protein [Hoeflea sp.]
MSSRETVLGKIRASIGVSGADEARKTTVAARLEQTPTGVIPARAQLPAAGQLELFCAMAVQFGATVTRVNDYQAVPAEVSTYLRARNLPSEIRMGADERLANASWSSEKNLEVRHGASDGGDLAGVSHAMAGIAETGTLALLSGPANPTTINFLPEHHIVVLKADDIKGDMESVWAMLRKDMGKGVMPRALNLITGPSRSGDIEQTIILGAHGPRALHIVIVD